MSTNRFFVSLDEKGRPLHQRNTVKQKPYLAASYDGGSFSSSPPNGAYPRKVIEVPTAIEWVARATLADGSKVVDRSKSGPPGRNCLRYAFNRNGYSSERLPAREERTVWTNLSREEYTRRYLGAGSLLSYEVLEFTPGTVEVRNWPTAGDSIVLGDEVRT